MSLADMNTITKCRLVFWLGVLVSVPGIAVLTAIAPLWALFVVWPTFWFSGMCFIIGSP